MNRDLSRTRDRRSAFTLIELLVVISIIGMLLGILLPAVSAGREAARKSQCANNLRQVGIGILSFSSTHNQFPTGSTLIPRNGRAGLSWHVFILPQIELGHVFDKIDPQPNGMAKNLEAATLEIPVFLCPSTPSASSDLGNANYAGVTGAGRLADTTKDLEDMACGDYFTDGILYPDSQVTPAHIKDGHSNTVMVGERFYWTEDWTYGAAWKGRPDRQVCMNSTKNVRWPINGSRDTFGYHPLDPNQPEGAKRMLLNDAVFESFHSGGASFIYADGHLEFLTNDLDIDCYRDMATVAGAAYQADSGVVCE